MSELSVTPPPYMHLLDAPTLARLRGLEFRARAVMEGSVSGRHRSPHHGFSVEFAEHREYAAGDSSRHLDWRVFGKSDRYYVKQFIEETNLRATILLDASGSMAYSGDLAALHDGRRLSKFDYGRYLAATLFHLFSHQQDAVGLVTFDSQIRCNMPARGRATHMRALLEALHRAGTGGETAIGPVLHEVAERIPHRGLVIIISDLLDDPASIVQALHHFRFCKHEVIIMHVLAEEELTFPFTTWGQFQDLEDSDVWLEVDPRAVRAGYLHDVQEFVQTLKKSCGEMAATYVPFSTHHDFGTSLLGFLSRHGRRTA